MTNQTRRPLRLKAMLTSMDGGKTWVVSRQFFLVDIPTNQFLNEELLGMHLAVIEEGDDHDDASKSRA